MLDISKLIQISFFSFLNKVYAPGGPKDAWIRKISFVPRERRKDALMLRMSVKSNTVVPHHSELSKFFFFFSFCFSFCQYSCWVHKEK